MGYDPSKSVWYNPSVEYIFGTQITEYDIRDAGFNIIKQYRLLPDDKIRELEILGKGVKRHIEIGKLQGADKQFSKIFLNKFAEVREIFIKSNSIDDNDIISVKKDAIFIIGSVNRTRFGGIEFAVKNTYTSYIRFSNINNLEIYYSDMRLDIKGMSEISQNRHRLYMISFIQNIMKHIEDHSTSVKRYIKNFSEDYKSGKLDNEYYIEFNNKSRDINPVHNYLNIIIPFTKIILREVR